MLTRSVRALLAALTAALAVLALSACGSSDDNGGRGSGGASSGEPKKIFTFVFAPRGFNDVSRAWSNGLTEGAAMAGDNFTVEQKSTARLELDPAQYLQFIQQALVQQPDGIVVVPNNASAMKAGLEKIAADGTPVLIMDQDVPDMRGKVSFVGADDRGAGAMAAEWLAEQAKAGKLSSKEVGIMRLDPGVTSTDARFAGFTEALRGTDLKLVSTLTIHAGDVAGATTKMTDMLTANPDLGAVYSVDNNGALGIAKALQKANKTDIAHVSVDGTRDTVETMLAGQGISAQVALDKFGQGRESVVTLARYLNGDSVPPVVHSEAVMVTPANGREYLKKAAEDAQ
jgi:ribose transport system substrate-binding protein